MRKDFNSSRESVTPPVSLETISSAPRRVSFFSIFVPKSDEQVVGVLFFYVFRLCADTNINWAGHRVPVVDQHL